MLEKLLDILYRVERFLLPSPKYLDTTVLMTHPPVCKECGGELLAEGVVKPDRGNRLHLPGGLGMGEYEVIVVSYCPKCEKPPSEQNP